MSSSMLLIVACVAMSMCLTIAQLPPFFGLLSPDQDLEQCWSPLQSVEGCVSDIYTSFANGRIGSLGPACCEAITNVNDTCWPKMFPYSPFYPPMLKQYCTKNEEAAAPAAIPKAHVTSVKGIESAVTSSVSLEGLGNDPEFFGCLSALQSEVGCIEELATSFFSFQIRLLGPACCKAITTINDQCWPKICPFNPFFPPLVKDYCSSSVYIPNPPFSHPPKIILH